MKVACQEIVLVMKGTTFPCKATAGKRRRDVTVGLTDDQGHFSYRVS